ncbi:Smr/MutS family protein [Allosphingosinicella sp.]|uniref:Smr/MutS family protein n=1 Tax=Allosphingosinicella sp. TaxID=2823234 RepID=UPI002F256F50
MSARRLGPEERALWAKVVASVRPLHGALQVAGQPTVSEPRPRAKAPRVVPPPPSKAKPAPGTTLDGTWDRRLSRGLVSPDITVDLHGHNLANAYSLLDRRLDQALSGGARLVLLITGKPPSDDRRPAARGAIRAAVGDWLAASRHSGQIAAVRNAHPRHGGSGALYIVLRRRREPGL